jgi:hypothetical protein
VDWLDPETWKRPAALAEQLVKLAAAFGVVVAIVGAIWRWGGAIRRWVRSKFGHAGKHMSQISTAPYVPPRVLKPEVGVSTPSLPPELAESVPDVRVADHPRAAALFEHPQSDILFPLMESNALIVWARSMKGEDKLLRITGNVWRTHFFRYFPKNGDQTQSQTFIKTQVGQQSIWYDIHINQKQIEKIWLELEWLSILYAARLAHEICEEIGILDLVSSDSGRPNEALSYHVNAFLVREYPLMGYRPPSSVSRPIPNSNYANLQHIAGTNSLASLFASEPLRYDDVEIIRADLNGYLQSLRNAARAGI